MPYQIAGIDVHKRMLAVVIADVSSERLTRSGSVVGFAAPNDSHAWLGIPYAQPPVGPPPERSQVSSVQGLLSLQSSSLSQQPPGAGPKRQRAVPEKLC